MSAPKILAATPIPPVAGEERDFDKRRWGWAKGDATTAAGSKPLDLNREKNIAAGPLPPF